MNIASSLLLFGAALLGGTLNAVAGGGTFLTVPALIFSGVLPITANATSTVALWPGSLASASAYRRELATERPLALLLGGSSIVGGALGAIILLHTSQSAFVHLLPYLLLVATLLFIISKPLNDRLRKTTSETVTFSPRARWITVAVQFVIALYGGYFGGGASILVLALLSMMNVGTIHAMNALKTLLAASINGVAVIFFVVAGVVVWPQALTMLVGAIIGGYGGASIARRLDPRIIRIFVIVIGITMTIYFFVLPTK